MKRLYIVAVAYEYAAMAETATEAEQYADEVARDSRPLSGCARARLATPVSLAGKQYIALSDGWDDDYLVYGADGDVTFADAKAAEEAIAAHQADRLAEEAV